MHSDTFSLILLELAFVTLLGLLGRAAARGLGQPSVLGELIFGILAVNLAALWGVSLTRVVSGLQVFAELGVILLLFMAGIESRISEFRRVGKTAVGVALVGVAAPTILGLLAAQWVLPDAGLTVHLFVAAALCATSVGITARVFRDLGRLDSREAKIILGAAVIDDILGLILLAVVSSMASATDWDLYPVMKTFGLSLVFIASAVTLGPFIIRRVIEAFEFLDPEKFKLYFSLSLCFALSWLASQIGLSSIVGAFVAGLILNDEDFKKRDVEHETLAHLLFPIESFLAPLFFVLMGLQVNLMAFLNWDILLLALSLTAVGVAGKLLCAWPAGKHTDRLSVALGMVPRGEVGLIFAAVGRRLGVLEDNLFTAVVMMAVLTTLITPPALRWSLNRHK